MLVKTIDNFLDEGSLKEVNRYFLEQQHTPCWINNHNFFPNKLNKNKGTILVTMIPASFNNTLIDYFIDQKIFKRQPTFFDALLYIGLSGSSIYWHKDGQSDQHSGKRSAASIYLTEDWQDEWGGWFLYKNQGEVNAIKPEYNRAVILFKDVEHCTTVISNESLPRKSLQLFFNTEVLYD